MQQISSINTKSLAQHLRSQMLWIGGALLIGAVVVLLFFSWRSSIVISNSLMRLEATSLSRLLDDNPNMVLPIGYSTSAFYKFQQIPLKDRSLFNQEPKVNGEILEARKILTDNSIEFLYLLRFKGETGKELFLLSRHTEQEINSLIDIIITEIFQQALWLVTLVFLLIFILMRWVLRKTHQPIDLLAKWSENLAIANIEKQTNNQLGKRPIKQCEDSYVKNEVQLSPFNIVELNKIAEKLQSGIIKLENYNQREQEFLKHASHEIRTPLAIIQASLDTLELLDAKQVIPNNLFKKTVSRAQKASENLRLLSSSLLWIARDSKQEIPKEPIELIALCENLVSSHQYLLLNPKTTITIKTSDYGQKVLINIEVGLFSIVLANIIRNALQHSDGDLIEIQIDQFSIVVSNQISASDNQELNKQKIQSFGLCIQLVDRICDILGWSFEQVSEQSSNTVKLKW